MMLAKKWQFPSPLPQKILRQFSELNPLVVQLLWQRGIIKNQNTSEENRKAVTSFLSPQYQSNLYDPFLMKGMDSAVSRILKALRDRSKIAIWGDYDVDGLTATALMFETLKFLKAKEVLLYLPEKEKEGYGLNKGGIEKLAKEGVSCLITVDCGIASYQEINLARKLGIDVIVTDHHHVPPKLPQAYAILNPKQRNCSYPFKDLSGVGVAFKLASGLLEKARVQGQVNFLKWLLDLVAVGTLADIVSLLDENRVLVKYGLIVLGKTRRIGLALLMQICGIDSGEVLSSQISYHLAPRLNAAGRMGEAKIALELLLAQEAGEAAKLASEIDKLNEKRQRLTEKILAEARAKIGEVAPDTKIIMVSGSNWPVGVLGVVASRLKDEFSRPVLVFNKDGRIGKGSVRSVDGFDISEALDTLGDVLIKFGGHSRAAGLSLPEEFFDQFYDRLHKLASQKIKPSDLRPVLNIDAELKLSDIDLALYNDLSQLEPFGLGNHQPHFLFRKVEIKKIDLVGGKKQHLKLVVSQGDKELSAIGFGFGASAKELKVGDKIDIVSHLISDDYNSYNNLTLKIIDWRKQ